MGTVLEISKFPWTYEDSWGVKRNISSFPLNTTQQGAMKSDTDIFIVFPGMAKWGPNKEW